MVDGLDKNVQHKLTSLVSAWIFGLLESKIVYSPLFYIIPNSCQHCEVSLKINYHLFLNAKFQCHDFVEDHEEEALPIFQVEGGSNDEREKELCTELLGLLAQFTVSFM